MKKIILLIVLTLFGFSCKKKTKNANTDHPVPSIPVYLKIFPGDPLYFKLQALGGWMYIDNVGINGIVLYRKSNEEFVALERTSSYAINNPAAKVQVQGDNFTLRDTISGSEWRIFDGTVTKEPAQWPLRVYGTSYNNNQLIISN